MAEPLRAERPSVDTYEAPYFVDLVKSQLGQRYDQQDLGTQNLSIHTTLDLRMQERGAARAVGRARARREVDAAQAAARSRCRAP